MWPFKKKFELVNVPTPSVEIQLKSITAPQTLPNWKAGKATTRADWSVETAIDEGYNASAIVYACVEKRAKLVASVPWKAYTKDAEGELVAAPDSKLQNLIDNPNPAQSFYEIMYNVSQSLDLAGQSFLSKVRAGVRNNAQELWYIPATGMKIAKGSTRLVDFYEYNRQRVDVEDMIMFRMPNPNDTVFGMPVLMAAGRATDVDRESGIWQKVSLENRGSADINIKLPDTATQEQVEQVKKTYDNQQTGPRNARKALITNADVQQMGMNAVEMDFVASRRAIWTEICAVFGMSLSNLGMTEDVNLANAGEMNKALWENTVLPQLELIKRQINHQLVQDFEDGKYILLPDLSGIEALQENRTEMLDNARKLFDMGVPFDAINQRLEMGFDEFEGSGIGYLSSSLIPASFNSQPDDDTDTDIGDNGEPVDGLGVGDTDKVQDAALNGAQISSLTSIVEQVALGTLPLQSAVLLIMAAFPALSEAEATAMLSPAVGFSKPGTNTDG